MNKAPTPNASTPSDIVDGKPSIVLGLCWNVILYFQVYGYTDICTSPFYMLTWDLPCLVVVTSCYKK